MFIKPEEIQEFRKLYRKHYGIDLTDDQAKWLGQRLVNLFQVVTRPIPKLDTEQIPVKNEVRK